MDSAASRPRHVRHGNDAPRGGFSSLGAAAVGSVFGGAGTVYYHAAGRVGAGEGVRFAAGNRRRRDFAWRLPRRHRVECHHVSGEG